MSASVDQHTSERVGEDASAPEASMRMYRVAEVMELLSLSRSVVYEQFRAGRLHSVKQGRSRRVPTSAVADYIALLQREAAGDGAA